MDNRYYDKVIGEMSPFLDEQGFAFNDDAFVGESKAFKVEYNEEKQMYILFCAEVENGKIGEYAQLDAWLFDDSQNAKDAQSVGIGFIGSVKNALGIKPKRNLVSGSEVALPEMNKSGSITIAGFTKKLLDIFPVLKEEYKSHVAFYGNFLYLNFFGEKVVPLLKAVMIENNKKQVKKINDLFSDVYVHGDKDTVNAEIALLCAAAYDDETAANNIRQMLDNNKHFLDAFNSFLPCFKANKKLKSALIK